MLNNWSYIFCMTFLIFALLELRCPILPVTLPYKLPDSVFSERELAFTFAICRRPSVCLSVCLSSVTFVHPTQAIQIFGNVSRPFNTLVI